MYAIRANALTPLHTFVEGPGGSSSFFFIDLDPRIANGYVVQMLMSPSGRLARLHYMANQHRVIAPGDHVLCAVSGARIPLDELRYWSVRRQEAYASAALATEALTK